MIAAEFESDGQAPITPGLEDGFGVDRAAIRDEARFFLAAGRAQGDRVMMEVSVDVAQRREQAGKEVIAWAIRLVHSSKAPQILPGGQRFIESREGRLLRDCLKRRAGK